MKKHWVPFLRRFQVPLADTPDPLDVLATPVETLTWIAETLPDDQVTTQTTRSAFLALFVFVFVLAQSYICAEELRTESIGTYCPSIRRLGLPRKWGHRSQVNKMAAVSRSATASESLAQGTLQRGQASCDSGQCKNMQQHLCASREKQRTCISVVRCWCDDAS